MPRAQVHHRELGLGTGGTKDQDQEADIFALHRLFPRLVS